MSLENPKAEFDDHDMELLEQARRESEAADAAALAEAQRVDQAQAGAPVSAPAPAAAPAAPEAPAAAPAAQAPAPAPAAASPSAAPAPAAAPAAAAPAEPAPKPDGDVRAALRASRVAERRVREENEALRRKLEAAGVDVSSTPAAPAPKRPDEAVLRDVKEYAAPAADYLNALERENAELKQRVSAAPAPVADFVPDELPPDLQEVVDDVPELLSWQLSRDHQDKWEAAKAADVYLSTLPEWRGKTLAERFQEAVERVKRDSATAAASPAPAPATADDAKRVIAAAPVVAAGPAVAIGDLRGGATPSSTPMPDYQQMVKAGRTDEEIMASLPVLP